MSNCYRSYNYAAFSSPSSFSSSSSPSSPSSSSFSPSSSSKSPFWCSSSDYLHRHDQFHPGLYRYPSYRPDCNGYPSLFPRRPPPSSPPPLIHASRLHESPFSSSIVDFRSRFSRKSDPVAEPECAGGISGGNGSVLDREREAASLQKSNVEKVCGVCGDKALGYNFDAITCESCKAFFRRNAPKGLDHFKCCYDGQCQMTLCNRRVCKRCRLSKCFMIGMRREYILTEDERMKKRQKIDENRSRRNEADKPRDQATTFIIQNAISQSLVTSETKALNVEDASAIQDLVSAYRDSLRVNVDNDPPRDHANLSDLVNIAELSVRRVIAMAKRLQAFKAISYQDQIHLLKGGSIELLILRSVLTFDKDKQHFLDPLDEEETKALKIDQLKDAESGTGLFEQHMKFVKSLTLDLNVDETSMILLLVIALFSPDRENLSDREIVTVQQERHCNLLKRYLESVHPNCVARTLFPKMLLKLADVRNLNEEHSLVLLKVNPDGIQPLMQEFLDLRC